jgi:hypothetical protein
MPMLKTFGEHYVVNLYYKIGIESKIISIIKLR